MHELTSDDDNDVDIRSRVIQCLNTAFIFADFVLMKNFFRKLIFLYFDNLNFSKCNFCFKCQSVYFH